MAKVKVLLVDDEAGFLQMMGMRIIEWGYDLLQAQNGQEAVRMVKNEHPDIVVLDYMMPDMDGITTLRAIHKINKNIPAIMFTAYPDKVSAVKDAEKIGISAFVPKLSNCSDVQASLMSALNMLHKRLEKK